MQTNPPVALDFFSQLCPNEETAPVRDESKPPAMITAASMWDVKHGNRLGHRVGPPTSMFTSYSRTHLPRPPALFQGLPEGSNSNSGYQIIFSLSAKTKISGSSTPPFGYADDAAFQKDVILAFKDYFLRRDPTFEPKLMEIKNLDNSQAGVGLFVRLYTSGGMFLNSTSLGARSPVSSLTRASFFTLCSTEVCL